LIVTVYEMNCPNCGAPVDFGGGVQTTCSFCRSVLALANGEIKSRSELADLLAGVPVRRNEFTPPSVAPQSASATNSHWTDFSDVADLAQQGQKLEAIQLYRERTGVGANEARYIVEAMARHEIAASMQEPVQPRSSKYMLWGCLPMLLFIGFCATFVTLSSQVVFRAWGPLDEALQIINNDFQVKHVFGQPITPGLFVTGKITGDSQSSTARFSVPIYGPRRSGELRGSGVWRKSVWDLNIWVIYSDNDGVEKTIAIARQVK
jgi:ribosomal protein L7/L12